MYPPGHVGLALALYAPIGLFALRRARPRLAVAGTFVVGSVTLLPDVDQWLPWLVHRGLTHSVWFVLAVGVSLGATGAILGWYRHRSGSATLVYGAFGLCVGTLAIVAHLLGDVITPMGVRPFDPLSDANYTLRLVYASDPTANAQLFALGGLATAAQLLFGIGHSPTASRRPTLRRARTIAGRYVRNSGYVPQPAPAEPSKGPTRPAPPVRETDD